MGQNAPGAKYLPFFNVAYGLVSPLNLHNPISPGESNGLYLVNGLSDEEDPLRVPPPNKSVLGEFRI